MKKTSKPNPLKVFSDNKAMAYKKAGGEMAAYKSNLKKLQNGGSGMGRMAADDAKFDAMMNESAVTNSMNANQALQGIAGGLQNNERVKSILGQQTKAKMPWNSNPTIRMEDYIKPYRNKKGGSIKGQKK